MVLQIKLLNWIGIITFDVKKRKVVKPRKTQKLKCTSPGTHAFYFYSTAILFVTTIYLINQ